MAPYLVNNYEETTIIWSALNWDYFEYHSHYALSFVNTLEMLSDPRSSLNRIEVWGVNEERIEGSILKKQERLIAQVTTEEEEVVRIPLQVGYGGFAAFKIRVFGNNGIWLQSVRLLTVMRPFCQSGDMIFQVGDMEKSMCPNGSPGIIERECVLRDEAAVWANPVEYCRMYSIFV